MSRCSIAKAARLTNGSISVLAISAGQVRPTAISARTESGMWLLARNWSRALRSERLTASSAMTDPLEPYNDHCRAVSPGPAHRLTTQDHDCANTWGAGQVSWRRMRNISGGVIARGTLVVTGVKAGCRVPRLIRVNRPGRPVRSKG